MPRKPGPDRVLGPYCDKSGWYLIAFTTDAKGESTRRRTGAASKGEAEEMKRVMEAELKKPDNVICSKSVEEYLAQRDVRPRTVVNQMQMLRAILANHWDAPVSDLEGQGQGLYDELRKTAAVATHRVALVIARSWGKWLVRRKLLAINPWAEVLPQGKARKGKPQLTRDEAMKWLPVALRLAEEHDGALAACLCLLSGLRAGEALSPLVRHLDGGGTLLHVTGKTGPRVVDVAEAVRPILIARAQGRGALEPLLRCCMRSLWDWTQRICDEAKVPRVCPHSLRGFHGTARLRLGHAADEVAAYLGHGVGVLRQSYAQPGAEDAGRTAHLESALIPFRQSFREPN